MVNEMAKDKTDNNFSTQSDNQLKIRRKKSDIKFLRLKRRILKHVWIVRVILIFAAIALMASLIYAASFFLGKYESSGVFGFANNFVFAPYNEVVQIDSRVNVLILGKGGEGHETPDLTDTITLLSINNKDKSTNMVSIPRDLWIDDLQAKVNSAYYWGNQKQNGGGIILAKSVVEEAMGEPIEYSLVFDFQTFVEIIDQAGGVKVDVETAFVDEKYPIQGKENDPCGGDINYKCRYETVIFDQGVVWMDGETALKYVRSRNAEGDEGTDIARSKRQQKVIKALVEEVTSPSAILSFRNSGKLFSIFIDNIETDLSSRQLAVVARMLYDYKDNINTHSIPEELFVVPEQSGRYDNLYVFIPVNDTWDEIHSWFKSVVSN